MKVNAYCFAQMMKYLGETDCSCKELAELTAQTARRYREKQRAINNPINQLGATPWPN